MCMPTTLGKVRVPGKACPVKNNGDTKKGQKRSTRGWAASVGGEYIYSIFNVFLKVWLKDSTFLRKKYRRPPKI